MQSNIYKVSESWKFVREYERISGNELDENVQTATLIEEAPPQLQEKSWVAFRRNWHRLQESIPLNRRLRALDEVMGCWRPNRRGLWQRQQRKMASPEARSKAKATRAKATRAKVSPEGRAQGKVRAKSPNTLNNSGMTPNKSDRKSFGLRSPHDSLR